jgi:diaminopimelate epimerase
MFFTKLQGLGNDFVLVNACALLPRDWSLIAKSVCERRFGVGADGLLLLLPSTSADFRMRMFNPDGSEAEACGNGLRCLVRYVAENNLHLGESMTIETKAGMRHARMRPHNVAPIEVSMGQPEFIPENIPVNVKPNHGRLFGPMLGDYTLSVDGDNLKLNFISMGNPHTVMFITDPVADYPLNRIGPFVERHELFPQHVNFEVTRVLDHDNIEMRVWERGAGETLACGSGACAAAVAAFLHGFTGEKIRVKLPGGPAEVTWDGQGEVYLAGITEKVFTGEWPE